MSEKTGASLYFRTQAPFVPPRPPPSPLSPPHTHTKVTFNAQLASGSSFLIKTRNGSLVGRGRGLTANIALTPVPCSVLAALALPERPRLWMELELQEQCEDI